MSYIRNKCGGGDEMIDFCQKHTTGGFYLSIKYADDMVILIAGKYFSSFSNLMVGSLKKLGKIE